MELRAHPKFEATRFSRVLLDRYQALVMRPGGGRSQEREARELEEIRSALQRIRTGEYGVCRDCREMIPIERLEKLPCARYCMECQADLEKRRPLPRPITFRSLGVSVGRSRGTPGRTQSPES